MHNKIYFERQLQTAWPRQVTLGTVGFFGVTFDVTIMANDMLTVTARHLDAQQGLHVHVTDTQALYDYVWSVWAEWCASHDTTNCPTCGQLVHIPTEKMLRDEQKKAEQCGRIGIALTTNPWTLNEYNIGFRCPCRCKGMVDRINLPYDYSTVEFKQVAWFAIWNGSLGMCQPLG